MYAGGIAQPVESTGTDGPGGHTERRRLRYRHPRRASASNGAGDFSSRDSIISPAITLPAGDCGGALTFDHYVATEFGYDGGNVKISVNGGAFAVIPAEAYAFNAPGRTLTGSATNTNPLAGEPGFTGTDGGQLTGSWGTVAASTSAEAGAEPGDAVQLRFDIGRDGCGGIDGWYVDNVKVVDLQAGDQDERRRTVPSRPRSARPRRSTSPSSATAPPATTPTGTVDADEGRRHRAGLAPPSPAARPASCRLPAYPAGRRTTR